MGLDIRIPVGLMFAIIGAILVAYGLIGDKSIYSASLGINVNLWWGAVLLVFGLVMFLLGKKKAA